MIVIACLVAASGCGSRHASGRAAVGQWSVVAIDGKAVPEGSAIGVDYRADGRLIVESTGADAPTLDQDWLKKRLDQLDLSGILTTLKIDGGGHAVEMNRKPGTIAIPSD